MRRAARPSGSLAEAAAAIGLAIAAGIGIAVLSGGVGYLAAHFVFDAGGEGNTGLPSAADPQERVALWVGETESTLALLRPLALEESAWRREDERLGRALVGDDADLGFAVLWIFNYDASRELVFDRAETPLVVAGEGGRELEPVSLPELIERRPNLRSDLATFLHTYAAGARRVTIPPRSFRRVIVARRGVSEKGVLGAAAGVEIPELELRFDRRKVRRHRLETYLASPGDRSLLLRGAL